MGVRFGKSFKIAKGVRLNVSKKGLGLSAGAKGARVSVGPRGKRITTSIPGTGISYSKQISGKHKTSERHNSAMVDRMNSASQRMTSHLTPEQIERRRRINKTTLIVFGIPIAVLLLIAIFVK